MNHPDMDAGDALIDERMLSKLKWRCRRGLLENDIFIERFFKRYESTLTVKQTQGLNVLMDLSDSDLLDLHLGRKTLAQVDVNLVQDEVFEVLSMLKKPPERSL
ncbi:succinate dehydrogenase assembly factor 2 [Rhodoferax sp.]|uniref:FAD assembly factor SdhE n=1 Tax=Rhodoferax sp. TaxID=50421 RepID=UPI0027266708|nr:succinate dehydrogenase assembly factor 2 [Rhodoferax sp.]MDO9145100.1 succinate dehydrogenase assembly factor 2 [Rhodoferax sp.]MDP1528790.1 succinate dehydrogenase assembly factor 2 [Rhodoferax sp.]MDP1943725.1 succinate dehydrogenase assembly factor 2 [Rhodoferax sp.]MDP2440838.1 succinate dehydrogenase assembly factor 2 [Rhodoferax sp.]MDP3192978.1 succinate dehydrogenase assembly factor 2 [Rhodoferax sp.]